MLKHTKELGLLLVMLLTVSVLAACGDATATAPAATTSPTIAPTQAGPAATTVAGGSTGGAAAIPAGFDKAKGCKQVGVLLPETDTSARWEGQDRPLLTQGLQAGGFTVDYYNANNNAANQQNQADTALSKGDCILVVAANDSDQAAAIVTKAKAQKVPVIAYDRLIQSNDIVFYVSFDNVKVGEIQGQYIVDHHTKGDHVAMINGAQTDNNAILFRQGALNKLQPLFDSGELVKSYDQYTPGWDNPTAQNEMDAALSKDPAIKIAYVANDGMANTVIASLKAKQLNGKVVVTGQDATVTGAQNILIGDQSMTVYKPNKLEAGATIQLVQALATGAIPAGVINGQTATKAGANIPSALEVPVAVTKDNVASTIIADNYAPKADVCKGLPAAAGAGICS